MFSYAVDFSTCIFIIIAVSFFWIAEEVRMIVSMENGCQIFSMALSFDL